MDNFARAQTEYTNLDASNDGGAPVYLPAYGLDGEIVSVRPVGILTSFVIFTKEPYMFYQSISAILDYENRQEGRRLELLTTPGAAVVLAGGMNIVVKGRGAAESTRRSCTLGFAVKRSARSAREGFARGFLASADCATISSRGTFPIHDVFVPRPDPDGQGKMNLIPIGTLEEIVYAPSDGFNYGIVKVLLEN